MCFIVELHWDSKVPAFPERWLSCSAKGFASGVVVCDAFASRRLLLPGIAKSAVKKRQRLGSLGTKPFQV